MSQGCFLDSSGLVKRIVESNISIGFFGGVVICAISLIVISCLATEVRFGCSFPSYLSYVIGGSSIAILISTIAIVVIIVKRRNYEKQRLEQKMESDSPSKDFDNKRIADEKNQKVLVALANVSRIMKKINSSKIKQSLKDDFSRIEKQIFKQVELFQLINQNSSVFDEKQINELLNVIGLLCCYNSQIRVLMHSSKYLFKYYKDLIVATRWIEDELVAFSKDLKLSMITNHFSLDWSFINSTILVRRCLNKAQREFLNDNIVQKELSGITWTCLLRVSYGKLQDIGEQIDFLSLVLEEKGIKPETAKILDEVKGNYNIAVEDLRSCLDTFKIQQRLSEDQVIKLVNVFRGLELSCNRIKKHTNVYYKEICSIKESMINLNVLLLEVKSLGIDYIKGSSCYF